MPSQTYFVPLDRVLTVGHLFLIRSGRHVPIYRAVVVGIVVKITSSEYPYELYQKRFKTACLKFTVYFFFYIESLITFTWSNTTFTIE